MRRQPSFDVRVEVQREFRLRAIALDHHGERFESGERRVHRGRLDAARERIGADAVEELGKGQPFDRRGLRWRGCHRRGGGERRLGTRDRTRWRRRRPGRGGTGCGESLEYGVSVWDGLRYRARGVGHTAQGTWRTAQITRDVRTPLQSAPSVRTVRPHLPSAPAAPSARTLPTAPYLPHPLRTLPCTDAM